jgi:hypothetical protein
MYSLASRALGYSLSALMTKQGGATGMTFASLDIDGRNVINISYAAAENRGLAGQNPWGVVFLKSTEVKALAMGFPVPLYFTSELKLSATVNEDGVVQIIGTVVHGK